MITLLLYSTLIYYINFITVNIARVAAPLMGAPPPANRRGLPRSLPDIWGEYGPATPFVLIARSFDGYAASAWVMTCLALIQYHYGGLSAATVVYLAVWVGIHWAAAFPPDIVQPVAGAQTSYLDNAPYDDWSPPDTTPAKKRPPVPPSPPPPPPPPPPKQKTRLVYPD